MEGSEESEILVDEEPVLTPDSSQEAVSQARAEAGDSASKELEAVYKKRSEEHADTASGRLFPISPRAAKTPNPDTALGFFMRGRGLDRSGADSQTKESGPFGMLTGWLTRQRKPTRWSW